MGYWRLGEKGRSAKPFLDGQVLTHILSLVRMFGDILDLEITGELIIGDGRIRDLSRKSRENSYWATAGEGHVDVC